jgi:hypothetical protein
MSTDRDTTRLVRSWLEEGVTALPDRVLDAVLDQVPATPQRRSWWPARRFTSLNTYTKFAMAAAAVLVVAVVGYNMLPNRGGTGGPSVSPSPTAVAPSASPTSPTMLEQARPAACGPAGGALDCLAPGTYRLSGDVWPGVVTMEVPVGWFEWLPLTDRDAYDALLVSDATNGGSGWGLVFSVPGSVAKDPCDAAKGRFGRAETDTVDELVAAMSRWPGFQATAPVPVTVGGYGGQLVELTSTRTTTDCPNGSVWTNPQGGSVDAYPMVGTTGKARTGTYRIVDVNGTLLVIVTTDFPETSPNELANGIPDDPTRHAADQVVLHQILDSIRIAALAQP